MIEPLYGLSSKEIVTSAERAQRIETVLKSQLTKQTNEFVDPAPVVKEGSEADFLIVYGQGPVLPGNLREHDDTQGDVNVYCRLNAVAAAAMYREGLTTKVILTGGDTFYFDKMLKNVIFVSSNLIFEGLNIILDYNVK